MSVALQLAVAQGGVALFSFGLLCSLRAMWRSFRIRIRGSREHLFDVYERRGKWMATPAGPLFRWLDALSYVVLFYLSLPMLMIVFGWRKGLVLVALPFVGIPIAMMVARGATETHPAFGLLGMLLTAIFRGIVGFVLGLQSGQWRLAARIARGWRPLGRCEASSGKEAVNIFNPRAPAP